MANDIHPITTSDSQIVLYKPNDSITLEVKIDAAHETVWLTQQQIADLFGTKQPAISKHLTNIFKSGELDKDSVHSILEYTATDGKTYKTQFYNLDAIISVGYRVNSVNATAFRRWATSVLRDYLLQGYTINRQLIALQQHVDDRLLRIEDRQQTPIQSIQLPHKIHDRFLLIDSQVYLLGNSLKDMGHTLSAAFLTGFTPEEVLSKLK